MRKDIKGSDNMEINLRKLFAEFIRKWWVIALAALVAASATLWYTVNYMTPKYRASVTIYVNSYRGDTQMEQISSSSLATAQRLVLTYVNIIKSDTVLTRVANNSDLDFTPAQLRHMISTEQIETTEMFNVHIAHPDPQTAADVANAIAREALAGIEELVEGSSAKVVDYARVPTGRFSPSYTRNTFLGGVIGAVAAIIFITASYLLDVRLKTAEDLEMLFDIPLLGQIPVFVNKEGREKRGYGYGYGYEFEQGNNTEKGG